MVRIIHNRRASGSYRLASGHITTLRATRDPDAPSKVVFVAMRLPSGYDIELTPEEIQRLYEFTNAEMKRSA